MGIEALVPSLLDGVAPDEEAMQLAYGADLIAEAGQCLRLSRTVIVTAQSLFHRFYIVVSLKAHSHVWAVAAALLIATKADEEHRRIRDIANAVHFCFCGREQIGAVDSEGLPVPLEYFGEPGYEWKSTIVTTERHMLKELGFHIFKDSPHKFVLVFINTLRDKGCDDDEAPADEASWNVVMQTAWKFANDVHRVRESVVESAESVACACIYLAVERCGRALPQGWEVVFGSTPTSCKRVADAIQKQYDLAPTAGRFVDIAKYGILEACGSVVEPRQDRPDDNRNAAGD